MENQKSIQLNKKNTVSVIAAAPGIDLDDEIYAINWFDLKRPWLYELYNQVAFPHVKEVGGQVHFKGWVKEKLKGPDEIDRQMLLIVKYPSADQFLKMLSNRMFLMKSVMRIKAVDYFTFGFTKRMDSGPDPFKLPQPYTGNDHYFTYHFQTKTSASRSLYEIQEILTDLNINIHFSGYKAALVGRSSEGSKLSTQPFLMDGIIVFSGAEKDISENLMHQGDFQRVSADHLTNSFYSLNRSI